MNKNTKPLLYYLLYPFVRLRYMFTKTVFTSEVKEPSVFISNHAQMDGLIMSHLYFSRPHYNWVINCALDEEKCVNYAYHDVFLGNAKKNKKKYLRYSKVVANNLPRIIRNCSKAIPVYHDIRISETLKQSLEALEKGYDIIIFAESPKKYSEYVNELQTGFVVLGYLYHLKTGKDLNFYPTYINRKRKRILVGQPTKYNSENSQKMERNRINDYLIKEITKLGMSLKKHKPTPFLRKEWYDTYGEKYGDDFISYWKMVENGEN